jgi:citronellol/citronellal dehydrogenase
LATAKAFATEGCRVMLSARSTGQLHETETALRATGAEVAAHAADVGSPDGAAGLIEATVAAYGGIDILVNNASALFLAQTPGTPMKRFDLMFSVNVRGTFAATQAAYPYLVRATNPHVLMLSPPLNLHPAWFAVHCAYTISKYGMSMCVLGMAEEFRSKGIAVNALWPRTMIETAASDIIGVASEGCRTADIMADAAHAILTRTSDQCTGRFLLDDDVLAEEGCRDFEKYAVTRGATLIKDLFVM